MSTTVQTSPEVKLLATVSYRELLKLTRGMDPMDKATFLGLETTFPLPDRLEGELWIYECHSLSHPGETCVTDTLNKTCSCDAGQKGQVCYHYHLCRRLEMFGRYRTDLRAMDRYERSTGASAVETIPPEGMDFDEFREYRQTRRSA